MSTLSSNVYTQLSNKQQTLTASTGLSRIGSSKAAINYDNITLSQPYLSVCALNTSFSTLYVSNVTSGC